MYAVTPGPGAPEVGTVLFWLHLEMLTDYFENI